MINSMQSYWVQIFILPKKLIKEVIVVCRKFLWSRSENSNKAPVAWKTMCLPRSCGGLNIKDMVIWNEAAFIKILWATSEKKDRLWIQ